MNFLKQKTDLLAAQSERDELIIPTDEMMDEADQTVSEIQRKMALRLKSREALFLKKLDQAIHRIHDGTFGECLDCGEEIGLPRLKARPTTTLCIPCKEEQERKEFVFAREPEDSVGIHTA